MTTKNTSSSFWRILSLMIALGVMAAFAPQGAQAALKISQRPSASAPAAPAAKPAEAAPAPAEKPAEAAPAPAKPAEQAPAAAEAKPAEAAPAEAKPAAAPEKAVAAEPAPAQGAIKEESVEQAADDGSKEPVKTGPLMVDSEPQGAKVFVDGEEYGVTPVVIEGLSPTPHELVLYHPSLGAFSRKTESGSGGVMVRLSGDAAGAAGAGFISVESTPANARVDVDGKNVGLAPIKIPLTTGRHTVLLSKAGYTEKELSINVAEKKTLEIKETLREKAGSLLIIAGPADADIFLDGQSVGKAGVPLRINEVASGVHEVRVEKKGYVSWKRENVMVVREKTETVLVSLYPEHNEASVRLYTEPEGARVWLDGKEMGVAGAEGVGFVTTKGPHVLKMEVNPAAMPGFRPLQVSVSFDEDKVDYKGVPFKLPVIDEAFINAQKLYERGESQEAMSFLDRVGKDQPSYPETRVMMIEILKDLGRTSEIPAEFEKLFDRQIYKKNPILNLSMGYWSIMAASKAGKSDAVKLLEKGIEALDRAVEGIDYFPAADRQILALKSYYYSAMASEMLFDLTGDKKYVKKGSQSWELFFGRTKAGEETLGNDWLNKARRHQTNLQYLEKKLGS